jgi:hypothetical protein
MRFSLEKDIEVIFLSYKYKSLVSYFSKELNKLFPNNNLYANLIINFVLNKERI